MVILRTRNKITDFLMILAWASPFNIVFAIISNIFLYVSCVSMTMYVCMYACVYEIGKQLVAILPFAILKK